MTGKFKTQGGLSVTVLEHDEANNILFAKLPNGVKRWVGKKEYSTWTSENSKTELVEQEEVVIGEPILQTQEDLGVTEVKEELPEQAAGVSEETESKEAQRTDEISTTEAKETTTKAKKGTKNKP